METHDIDSIVRKVIEESDNFYHIEANRAKERIWKQVRFRKQNYPRLVLLRSLVAACILLFICMSFMSIAYIMTNKSIKTLTELRNARNHNDSENYQNSLVIEKPLTATIIKSADTVYIDKRVIVSRPVVITKLVVDTVYVSKIVYVGKEQSQKLLTATENSITKSPGYRPKTNNYETTILISNNELKQGEPKKLQLKFGGNREQVNNGSLAFTGKF